MSGGGIDNLVLKAIEYEAKGKGCVAQLFIKADPKATGFIDPISAISAVCGFLKLPAPVGPDKASIEARIEILSNVGMPIKKDPSDPSVEVVKYGPFLKKFTKGLELSPLVNSDKFDLSDAEKLAAQRQPRGKNDLTLEEIHKVMDENLPKYYSSTTDAYLKMKPPHGVFRLNDFARFMRSIGIDLTNDNVILKELFAEYDKNKNGHLDAWEFIACFGPSINGHSYSSTSLKFGDDKKHKKQSRELLEKPLDATQTRAIIAERLPLHYKSSTKAFLAAKGGVNKRSNVIMFPDFKLWLQNMNIIVPDQTVRDLFAYLDTDGSGQVSCAEFIECFGHAISGEQSKNIQDAEHLSFHNTRPDQRVAVVPKKHQWTYDEVMRCLGERMGLIHTSSTKAFMRAKRCGKTTMDYEDLNRALLNLNIDAPEKVVKRMFRELDGNNDGDISAAEFVAVFGNAINGFSGSFETKPPWFHKEMAALSSVLKNINSQDLDAPHSSRSETSSQQPGHSRRASTIQKKQQATTLKQYQEQMAAVEAAQAEREEAAEIKAKADEVEVQRLLAHHQDQGGDGGLLQHHQEQGGDGGGGEGQKQPQSDQDAHEEHRQQQRTSPPQHHSQRSPNSARSDTSHSAGGGGSSYGGGGFKGAKYRAAQRTRPVEPQQEELNGEDDEEDPEDLLSVDLGSVRSGRSTKSHGSHYSRQSRQSRSSYHGAQRSGDHRQQQRPSSAGAARPPATAPLQSPVQRQQQQQRPQSAGPGGRSGSSYVSYHSASQNEEQSSAPSNGGHSFHLDPATFKPHSAGRSSSTKVKAHVQTHDPTNGLPLNNLRPFFTAKSNHETNNQRRAKSADPSRNRSSRTNYPSHSMGGADVRPSSAEAAEEAEAEEAAAAAAVGAAQRMSTKNLIKELRKRQIQQRQEEKEKETRRRSRSAPQRAKQYSDKNFDPTWETSAVRMGDASQGQRERYRMKDKLSRAQSMAKVLDKQEDRRVKSSKGKMHKRVAGGQNESDYWLPSPVMHTGVFHS